MLSTNYNKIENCLLKLFPPCPFTDILGAKIPGQSV